MNRTWRPDPIQKNLMPGPQIAKVTGPKGESIFCDDFGRVKVIFPWDRYNASTEMSSCWIRVSQGWAGAQYGMMNLPRVGHEVIVSFLDGDPDRPIITGTTYNAVNQSPYSLPEHKTKTVIRTESYKGKGFNELSFEDQSGKEAIYFHAQKDMLKTIKHDSITTIDHDEKNFIDHDRISEIQNDEHLKIHGNRYTSIAKNEHQTIKGDHVVKVDKNFSHDVSGQYQIRSSEDFILDSNSEIHFKSGKKIVLDAGDEITLKAGGSFISINASGVSIVGSNINLNAGGSASSGKSFNGALPIAPNIAPQLNAMHQEAVASEKVKPARSASTLDNLASASAIDEKSVIAIKSKTKDQAIDEKDAGRPFNKEELLYSDAIQKTANKYRVVIGLRAPNKLGQLHFKEGHPSKNFHIKAKSSATGPTAGFITQKALYSKVKQNTETIAKHNKTIEESLNKHGKLVPLVLSSAQIQQALDMALMKQMNDTVFTADYHGYTISFTIDNEGRVLDSDGPVMVLTNPPEKSAVKRRTSIVQNLDLPVTADYDLFASFASQK